MIRCVLGLSFSVMEGINSVQEVRNYLVYYFLEEVSALLSQTVGSRMKRGNVSAI